MNLRVHADLERLSANIEADYADDVRRWPGKASPAWKTGGLSVQEARNLVREVKALRDKVEAGGPIKWRGSLLTVIARHKGWVWAHDACNNLYCVEEKDIT